MSRKSYFAWGSVIAAAMISPAMAQNMPQANDTGEASTGIADIIVTATRREQTLQATPLAVTAVTAQGLSNRGINGLGDIPTGTIPGMNLTQFSGTPSILAISARGIGLSDPTQGTQDLVVPVYIDGVPLGRAQGVGLELIDPERIEFLRGPQGQLFGRNAEGGAIQFVAKRPSGNLGFDASGQIGNYGLNRERLRVDLPEFANLRLQGSVVHTQHDAYTKNGPKVASLRSQADYAYLNSFGYRFAAEWSPFDGFRANYTYDDSKIKDSQPYLVWVPVNIIGRTAFSPQPAGADDYPDRVNSPTYNEYFKSKSNGHGLTLQYEASDAITLKSITSYREASRHGSSTLGDALVVGGSASGILRTNAREDVDQNQWYQEAQAIGSFERLDVTVGGTYFREKVQDERRSFVTGTGFNAPALGLAPAALFQCIGAVTCFTSKSVQQVKTDSYGLYAQGTYTPPILDDKLELTAGIRYSDDRKVAIRTYIQPAVLPPITEATPSGPLPPRAVFGAKRWDPAFTIKYSFTDEVNAYVRYATAYRAGGANVRSSVFSSYGAEEVKSLEVGFKARMFDRRLSLNVAYYHQKVDGFQNTVQEQPTVNPALSNTVNQATPAKVDGLEAEAVLRLAEGLTLSAGYAYIDKPRFEQYDNPLTAVVDITRFYSMSSPKHSGNIAADYETPDLGFGKLALHMDYALSTGYWTTPGGLQVVTLAANYERPRTKTNQLNGRVSLREIPLRGTNFEIALFGKNLLNSTQYTYGFDGAASGAGFAQFLSAPRTYGIELRVRY